MQLNCPATGDAEGPLSFPARGHGVDQQSHPDNNTPRTLSPSKPGVPILAAVGTVLLLALAVQPSIKGTAVRRMAHALVAGGDQR